MPSYLPGTHLSLPIFRGLAILLGLTALVGCLAIPAEARTRKGDKFLVQGKEREAKKDWDGALDFYNKALAEDPSDPGYQLVVHETRFQASQAHVMLGLKLRKEGSLGQALVEFQKAYGIDPSSSIAEQEIKTTVQMIEREKKKGADSDTRGLTPSQLAKRNSEEKLDSMLPVPELRALNQQPINLKMNNQSAKVLFETAGKLAGINVLFDAEFKENNKQSIELAGATLNEALDYLAIVTKTFWKPLSANTIFVTQDSTTKRRDYEEQVMKVFYLTNVTTPQELQEIVTAVRSVADIQRLFVYNAQNAIIARGEADRVALAEKIIHDLDKPKSEVVVDVLVLQVSSDMTRTLGAALSSLNIPVNFAPRSSISTPGTSTTTAATSTSTTNTAATTTGTTTGTTSTAASIPLAYIGKINTEDFSTVLPSGTLQAVLSDSGTHVLQSPQLRSVDNQKATLKIGEKEPIASGSFQSGVAGVGVNPLVNTQFTFIDVGVNVDLTPKVHDNGEISMHVEVEISSVQSYVNLGGISQPIIAQQKVIHDIRMKDGEVNLLAGLKQVQDSTTLSGIPGLSSIPIISYLFSSKTVSKSSQELVIALIPHIVRRPDYTEEEMRGIAVGNATVVKLNYAHPPQTDGEPAPKAGVPPNPGASVVAPPAASGNPPAAPPATSPNVPQAVPTAPQAAPAAPPANTTVNFVPGHMETIMGQSISVNLVMTNASDLFSAPIQIKYDPAVLKLTDVAPGNGNLMASDGQQPTFTKNILNDTGEADITLNRLPGTPGVTGSGMLLTLSFTTLARGATSVSVPAFSPTNSQGQPLSNSSPLLTVTVR
ncbi:MAG TPA: cohesin domain-containing protein [Bryobacteraceae bacterium]|nr:cohesin domain-containing protein [Bryobacteraceae bacterium]